MTEIEFPRGIVTLAALDILFENPGERMNGITLTHRIEERTGRDVNYSGVLKQVRSFANKPYWKSLLGYEKGATLLL